MYCEKEFIDVGSGVFPVRHEVYVGQGRIANQRFIHQGMLLGYDIEGATFEQTDCGEYFVLPGQVICLPPETWHTVTEDGGKPLQSIWMEIVGPAVESLVKLFGTSALNPVIQPAAQQEVYRLFREIGAAFHSPERVHPAHFMQRFYRIAELCHESSPLSACSKLAEESLAERAKRNLESGLHRFPTASRLAEKLGVSTSSLLQSCKKEFGISTTTLITQVKLHKACELLRISNHKLLHIAHSCGFQSPSHFISAFRAHFKTTPTVWRQSSRS
ncbi:MAG: hypothetical protein RLZZ142_14 [Verrucomicrobiota bacterium]